MKTLDTFLFENTDIKGLIHSKLSKYKDGRMWQGVPGDVIKKTLGIDPEVLWKKAKSYGITVAKFEKEGTYSITEGEEITEAYNSARFERRQSSSHYGSDPHSGKSAFKRRELEGEVGHETHGAAPKWRVTYEHAVQGAGKVDVKEGHVTISAWSNGEARKKAANWLMHNIEGHGSVTSVRPA